MLQDVLLGINIYIYMYIYIYIFEYIHSYMCVCVCACACVCVVHVRSNYEKYSETKFIQHICIPAGPISTDPTFRQLCVVRRVSGSFDSR
jgi:hypothetical protein